MSPPPTAFMPEDQLSGWFKVAAKINPVTYVPVARVMEAMRAMTPGRLGLATILTGVWVAVLMMTVLLAAFYVTRRPRRYTWN